MVNAIKSQLLDSANKNSRVNICIIFIITINFYIVSQKNDTDVAHYNFNAHQPILVIFGTDVADDWSSHLS